MSKSVVIEAVWVSIDGTQVNEGPRASWRGRQHGLNG